MIKELHRVVDVSIHAPAWGATCLAGRSPTPRGLSFNPRTRVGCDISANARSSSNVGFNPRTRVGCDFFSSNGEEQTKRFQSTHPRGVRRGGVGGNMAEIGVSIHAPAWGATGRVTYQGRMQKFQSTHPRGVRLKIDKFNRCLGFRFNPRTRVGCDP